MQRERSSAYPLRLDMELMDKVKKLADEHERSFNKQVEFILKQYVKEYEDKYGSIM